MSDTEPAVDVHIVPKLIPVFDGKARYRGAYGGRGSGKTRSFAKMVAVKGYELAENGEQGMILCARQFMNSLSESSMAEIKAAIAEEPFLTANYDVGETYIRTKDGNITFEFVGLARNLDSIKSKARIHICWIDEAENVSEAAWIKLLPTVRENDSEVWITWNPEREKSPTNQRFRVNPPADAKIVEVNYRDNPRFPAVLEAERLEDKEKRPDQYPHIWDGQYLTVVEGAYYAKVLQAAKEQGRIGPVPADPLMQFWAYWDIGGTGAKADATAIWIVQKIGLQIRVLDYYEAQGQDMAAHVTWLRSRGYVPGKCEMVLPHDGVAGEKVVSTSYDSALRAAGYSVKVVPNMGTGAASLRVEAVRRIMPSCWFNEDTTKAGRDALGWYHEKRCPERNVGLGPNHDWSSHCADAFGLMCVDYETPKPKQKINYGRGAPV